MRFQALSGGGRSGRLLAPDDRRIQFRRRGAFPRPPAGAEGGGGADRVARPTGKQGESLERAAGDAEGSPRHPPAPPGASPGPPAVRGGPGVRGTGMSLATLLLVVFSVGMGVAGQLLMKQGMLAHPDLRLEAAAIVRAIMEPAVL